MSAHAQKYRDYSRRSLWAVLLLLLLISSSPPAFAQARPSFTDQVEARVAALVNQFRAENGLQPLELESRLGETARYLSAYMASNGRLDHRADGTTPEARATRHGYDYCVLAENLAYEYNSRGFAAEQLARGFVQGGMESPMHRANMLEPDVTETGLAVSRARRNGEYYAVQMFGRPATHKVKFSIANRSGANVRYEFRKRSVPLGPRQVRSHESCVGGDVTIDWPYAQEATTIRPKSGGRYVITGAGKGPFRIDEE